MTSSGERVGSLAEIQDWLRRAVTAPGGVRAALRDAAARHEALPVRVPPGVPPAERLAIYARGYLDRLLSCLRADYPATRALVGDEIFDGFAIEYLRARPPRHPSLFQLGDGFAAHLASTCPDDGAVAADRRSWLRLPIDLARLERARLEAIRAPGLEAEAAEAPGVGPGALLGAERERQLVAAPCLRLVELEHDPRPFLAAVDRGEPPGAPEPRRMSLAISRFEYRITMTETAAWQHQVLMACRTPCSLAALVDRAAPDHGADRGAALAALLVWLPVAEGLGLIRRHGGARR
ncbi:MAG TPA: DNA-binding domain-containing protein [Kofleriaceae bacterium]|jgi:hypothetical protein|nr:DNA-binding domain-containing protein [Kofleriaceae bacterium]